MKSKIINPILFACIATMFFSCKEDLSMVHYPASTPNFQQAAVKESTIVYGDSITVNAEISDKMPLSTLEVMVVVNDQLIEKESVRTAGNSYSYNQRFSIPFGPYMPDNVPVEVHLSSINVEGFHRDTVLTTAIATRPLIPTMYMVERTKTVELTLTDPKNYIYSADNLTFGNDVAFLLPTIVTRFNRVDWTGLVFGDVNGSLGIVQQGGDSIKISDASLVGIKSVKLDLFNFTVTATGDPMTPATSIDVGTFSDKTIASTDYLNVTTPDTWKITQLYLGKDVEITFAGIGNLANGLTPDFFEVTGENTAKFLGETGVYTLYYLPSADYLYMEQPNATFPDVMWFDGVGFGRPATPYAKTSSWNWNSPLEYAFCRKVSPGVFQVTIYVNHEINDDPNDGWRYAFNAKFFWQRGWGSNGVGEVDARQYTISTDLLYAPTTQDQGNFSGMPGLAAAPGVYRFTIDTNAKKADFVKIK